MTCLGVMIDTVKGTIAIPPEKLEQINSSVCQWLKQESCVEASPAVHIGLITIHSQMCQTSQDILE